VQVEKLASVFAAAAQTISLTHSWSISAAIKQEPVLYGLALLLLEGRVHILAKPGTLFQVLVLLLV